MLRTIRFILIAGCGAWCLTACHDQVASSALSQRAYVWQREWTPAVSEAVKSADASKLDGLILFGAEIVWNRGKPRPVRCSIDWQAVRSLHKPVSIAMRIAPYAGPFAGDDDIAHTLADTAKSVLTKLKDEHVRCMEFQLDFDCPQKKLANYALWLKTLRKAVSPTRFVITTLPAWLDEPEFVRLFEQADGYVLQVHSIPPSQPAAHAFVCEPDRARRWVAKAVKLAHPFEVALSTYSAVVGYDEAGKLRGVALDAVQPSWPEGTRTMHLDSDAEALSALANEWRASHSPHLRGIIWYRLPVATDQRNWRTSTFSAVIEGRGLIHQLIARATDGNPADLSIVNAGNLDENFTGKVMVRWPDEAPVASDAMRGWSVRMDGQHAEFTRTQPLRLPPGASRSIGWLRFNQRASLHVEVIR